MFRTAARPAVAIAFGLFLIGAETCRHIATIDSWRSDWPSLPFYDWIAGGLLVFAGTRAHRRPDRDRALLIVAWSFVFSLLVAALFAHLEDWFAASSPNERLYEAWLLAALGALTGISFYALLARCVSAHQPMDRDDSSIGRQRGP